MGKPLTISVLTLLVSAIVGLILLVCLFLAFKNDPRNYPSFANYPFDHKTPSGGLIEKWFHELNDEALRQGIMCYVDPKTVATNFPGLQLRERTQYNLNWVDEKGYVVTITKNLTDAKGQAPVVNGVPLPSSTTCTYWVQSGEESCSCKYSGGKQPGEDFFEELGLSYPVYKRKPHRPASEITVDMFGPNENPEPKLQSLSKLALITLYRNMFPKDVEITLPQDVKLKHPELGLWTFPSYTSGGNENEGHNFEIKLRFAQSVSNGAHFSADEISFNTKTREIDFGGDRTSAFSTEALGYARPNRKVFMLDYSMDTIPESDEYVFNSTEN